MSSQPIHGPLRDAPQPAALKGRGTAWAIEHRFTRQVSEACDDGWGLLDQQASERHKVPYAQVQWEADRVALLQRIEPTAFFQKIRGDLVVSLYNQKELWPKFGYEGSSAEHGGYMNRGFADIDWLPKV